MTMATMTKDTTKVCVFCEVEASEMLVGARSTAFCPQCKDYKGIMTVSDWEVYTGETWFDSEEDDINA